MSQKDFESFFQGVYGERWPALYQALHGEGAKLMRLTFPTLHQSSVPSHLSASPLCEHCFEQGQKGEYFYSENQLKIFYIMDPASIMVARSLSIKSGMKVLDMCSAPGGKGLVLAESLGQSSELFLNEFSRDRRDRLTQVVRDYVPMDLRPSIFVKGKDGALYGLSHPNYFDAILVDAPCSGEQHLVHSSQELDKWTLKRTKRLAQQQYSMLCSALLAAKDGAEIVYSTCSISPFENDGVIEKLCDKKSKSFEILPLDLETVGAEKTQYGYIFLPDRGQMGPMYVCKLKVKK